VLTVFGLAAVRAEHLQDRAAAADCAEASIERAWQKLGGSSADAPAARPRVSWAATTAVVATVSEGGRDTPTLRVDPRLAEELERLLVATAIADRLRVRETLREYAVDRALAIVRGTSAPPMSFWDVLGWTGPGRELLAEQPSFGALVDSMRDQAYLWLVARALATEAEPGTPPGRAEAAGRRLLAAGEWPLFPLAGAVLVVAAEDPRGAEGSETWLCGAAAVNYAGARLLRRDPALREAMGRDRVLRARLAAWLAELDLLNEQQSCGLAW
jgi:hypothetical protein